MKMNANSGFGPWKRTVLFACLFLFCVSGGLSALPVEDYSDETLPIEDYNGETLTSTQYADSREPKAYPFLSNWFVGVSGGGLIYFADHTKKMFFGDRLSFGGEAWFGKWWSPYIATRIGFSMQQMKGAIQNWIDFTAEEYGVDYQLVDVGPYVKANFVNGVLQKYESKSGWGDPTPGNVGDHLWLSQFNTAHIYGDVLVNVSNLFGGVKDSRFWSLSPYAGVGWMWVTTKWPKAVGDENLGKEITASAGLLNSFRLGKMVDLVLDIRGTMTTERIHVTNRRDQFNMGSRRQDGILSASLGIAVHLGKRDWAPPTGAMSEAEMAVFNERMAEANRENAAVRKSLNEASRVDRVTEWRTIATDVYIRFDIGQSVLLREARVQLGFLARMMKEYPESTYTISGYADAATGTREINARLSRERSEIVKACLVREFGIEPFRLTTEAMGGIENRYYNDPYLSRATIIRPNK